jgi:type IV pilus assembly protein PilQ
VPGADAPGIMRKEAKTTILLKDGETAVIGGIFTITQNNPMFQVPYLGNLPVIGKLFQDRIDENRNEELIIFLTPQIIKAGSATGESVAGVSP